MPRDDPRERAAFAKARRAENGYGVQLRRLAKHVTDIINGVPLQDFSFAEVIQRALDRYSEIIEPWAEATADRMLKEVSLRDSRAWEVHTRQMGYAIRREIQNAPTGLILRQLQDEQVALIKSIPLEAAQKVHERALAGISTGERFEVIAKSLLEVGDITKSRANLIARTEVGRAASSLTQARAQFIGSEGYTWRTSEDVDVRLSHQAMEGKYVPWNKPPKTDKGLAPYHAGCGPNCRCYAEPVIPNKFFADDPFSNAAN